MARVDVLAFDGVLDAALGITRDVLSAANRIAGVLGRPAPFEDRLCSPRRAFTTGTGLRIIANARLGTGPAPDVVLVLGMNVPTLPELAGALGRAEVTAALPVLRSLEGARLCASCSGTFVLGAAGLLDDREATTSWWLAPELARRHPRARVRSDAMVVRSGRIVTAGAALAQVDLMLWLVRTYAGAEVAELTMRYLVVDERPSQARYLVVDHLAHESEEVARADAFARRSLARAIGLADLAKAAKTSPRTLERRFHEALGMSPLRYVQRLRVERAVHLLATTRAPLPDIAAKVGYDDVSTLRRLVRRETGATPAELRARAPRPGTARGA